MRETIELAREYHQDLPARIRRYLTQDRGISDELIECHLLGWNGSRIAVPIFDRNGNVAFFKLAKNPEDKSDSPKMLASLGARAELYGWERVLAKPDELIICEGEFDRLVLESNGFAAVTSTGGAGTFRAEWAEALSEVPRVYVCFDRDEAGCRGTERVAWLLPNARIVQLPEDVGDGGDVTDFFVRLGRSREEFLKLLDGAVRPMPEPPAPHPASAGFRDWGGHDGEIARVKSQVRLEEIAARYLSLRNTGTNYTARCPFHEDRTPSFVVFSATQTFYCFGCQARGDVLNFLMRIENLSFPEALNLLRGISPSHGPRNQTGG